MGRVVTIVPESLTSYLMDERPGWVDEISRYLNQIHPHRQEIVEQLEVCEVGLNGLDSRVNDGQLIKVGFIQTAPYPIGVSPLGALVATVDGNHTEVVYPSSELGGHPLLFLTDWDALMIEEIYRRLTDRVDQIISRLWGYRLRIQDDLLAIPI